MNNADIFFLTATREEGRLFSVCSGCTSMEGLGNFFLTPVRYLWGGKRVVLVRSFFGAELEHVHHVASFHPDGEEHVSRGDPDLHSSFSSFLRTVAAITCLIPGFILGVIFKWVGYLLSEQTEKNHRTIKRHFETIDVTIGKEQPLTEQNENRLLDEASEKYHPDHPRVENLFIYGNNILEKAHPIFLETNAKKIILIGTRIINSEKTTLWEKAKLFWKTQHISTIGFERIDEQLVATGKFETHKTEGLALYDTHVVQHHVANVEEALADKPPLRDNGLPYHRVYVVDPSPG